ncbi:unnamed protein product [Prunus armeniaca]
MPFSVFQRLGQGDLKPTSMILQLADRSITYPRGVIEDLIIKVDNLYLPADFVVLDMDEDLQTPIILGRPFMATVRTLIDVEAGTLTLRVQDQSVVFNLLKTAKRPMEQQDCMRIDMVDRELGADSEDEGVLEYIHALNNLPTMLSKFRNVYESLGEPKQPLKPSRQQPQKLELKPLLEHLKYAYLGAAETLPVIIAADLTPTEEDKLLRVLRKYQGALGWTIADIKGISPALCMHIILMEDDVKPTADAQHRLNPIMKEVVRTKVMKLLDAGMIYPISDSKWVSQTQVVPKRTGITVVKNDNNELIPTRLTTGWRMCVDYWKLNTGTRKYHFPLPVIDQMLERLAGCAFYCFLYGYSGYNQIPIAPEDQEKTTFTCPFGTYAYRRMPFRLCNAPTTFQRCMMSIFSGLVENIVEVFMDDFYVFGDSYDQCLQNLSLVLERCQETVLAYYRVEWQFLEQMLRTMGFPIRFIQLIMGCVTTVSYLLLIQGRPFGRIIPSRGLRQGDPISPYLFLIVAEAFSVLLQQAERDSRLHGVSIAPSAHSINHLFFADDSLPFCNAGTTEALELKRIFGVYEAASGQKVNLGKSALCFSPSPPRVL